MSKVDITNEVKIRKSAKKIVEKYFEKSKKLLYLPQ
jgi:hypothetical protein